jgi:PAS domain S-box-containing protein
MYYLITTWKAVLRNGCGSELRGLERNRVMVVNGLSISMILLTVAFLLLFLTFHVSQWMHLLPALPLYSFVIILNYNQRHKQGRTFFFWGSLVLITGWCLLNRRSGAEYGLIALGCSTALIYEKKITVYASFLTTGIAFLSYKIADASYPFTPDPSYNYTLFPTIILLAAGGIVFFEMMVFHDLAKHYYSKLTQEYELLQEALKAKELAEEELKTSNDELNALSEQLEWIVKQKNSELQSYLDAINVNIYSAVTDLSGNILKVNDPLLTISGYAADELTGRNFRVLNAGHHPQHFFKNMMETIHSGKSWRGEVKNKARDGSFFWIDMVIIPIKNEKGSNAYFLTLALPITDRREAEEKQQETAKMLENITFRTSHKVRGPVARILGLINLVDKKQIQPNEIEAVAKDLRVNINEMDIAIRELTLFVNAHYETVMLDLNE